jgi:uncharacterized membrane protein
VNWVQFAVQWLHVLLGIFWFGYSLAVYFLVAPALVSMPEAAQRDTWGRLGALAARVLPGVTGLVVLLGILRGTVFGPIKSLEDVFGTAYGVTWLVALVVTIGLIVHGARFLGPATVALRDAPDFEKASARVRRLATADLAGFAVVFTCMILMRFGL